MHRTEQLSSGPKAPIHLDVPSQLYSRLDSLLAGCQTT